MAKEVGIVFVDVSGVKRTQLGSALRRGMALVPSGRDLVVFWHEQGGWSRRVPVESVVTETVLGELSSRRTESDWTFFGNGVVRQYGPELSTPSGFWHWIIFRKRGEKAYTLRRVLDEEAVSTARLDTLDPVFTRDVANNVWHVRGSKCPAVIIERFQALLSWPHETAVLVADGVEHRVRFKRWSSKHQLIGRPTKIDYQIKKRPNTD